MRVISGTLRGKKLKTLEGENTRPTLDRVKEALFSIIQFDIENASVLDLFAGSGSLGIETLSRGAKQVIFCDNSKDAIEIIKQNVAATRFTEKSEIINKDYMSTLEAIKHQKFDIIFLDPPYRSDFAKESLNYIITNDLLSKNGIVIIETDDINKKQGILDTKGIKIVDTRKYGSVMLIFVRKE